MTDVGDFITLQDVLGPNLRGMFAIVVEGTRQTKILVQSLEYIHTPASPTSVRLTGIIIPDSMMSQVIEQAAPQVLPRWIREAPEDMTIVED
jgi:hypothetical protein